MSDSHIVLTCLLIFVFKLSVYFEIFISEFNKFLNYNLWGFPRLLELRKVDSVLFFENLIYIKKIILTLKKMRSLIQEEADHHSDLLNFEVSIEMIFFKVI